MIDEFLVRAWLAGSLLAIIAGPLGCFVVWRRMSYLGAALSHAALLGIALGLMLNINLQLGVLIVCVVLAVLLTRLQRVNALSTDTLLGIFAHGALALGLIMLSFVQGLRIDLIGYLFGDILAVAMADVFWAGAATCVVLVFVISQWRSLLVTTLHEDLARVDGLAVDRLQFSLMVLLALVIATGMQIVGLLLVVSMLIIPAAVARHLAWSPVSMAVLASLTGVVSVSLGLAMSLTWDTPAGPSIVVAACVFYCLASLRRVRS